LNYHQIDMSEIDLQIKENVPKLNLEELLATHRFSITFFLVGLLFIGVGILVIKRDLISGSSKVEVLESVSTSDEIAKNLVVEVSGAVVKPGVYKLPGGSRVEEALIAAGGISADADRDWMARMVNRAALLTDGQKVYIPRISEQTNVLSDNNDGGIKVYQSGQGSGAEALININSASQVQLESLPGIGPVYAQSIIDHRPYSDVEELVSKGAIKQGVYDKVKDLIAVY
jgi:competence protein ComEA